MFMEVCATGTLPDGSPSAYGTIPTSWFDTVFRAVGSMANTLPPVTPSSPYLSTPMDRATEALGSKTNMDAMVLLHEGTNGVKGALFGLNSPLNIDTFTKLIVNNLKDPEIWLTWLHNGIAVSRYLQDEIVSAKFDGILDAVTAQHEFIDTYALGADHYADRWREFVPVHLAQVQQHAVGWLIERVITTTRLYDNLHPENYGEVMATLNAIITDIQDWKIPSSWIPGAG
ncbi:chitinase [Phlyctema vagabunda]|uniref:Chitinase n=1 Tax=Phlyctema vagabunda TaxID=108571 RepID=A0ABR4PAJ4_9HELO